MIHNTLDHLRKIIDRELADFTKQFTGRSPEGLYEPVIYSMQMGGKRLRPVMVLLGFSLFSDKFEDAIPAALAVEIFHNFTLLHDDIMDKSEMRRNMQTVHFRYNQNKAILSGDAMSFLSYQQLLKCNPVYVRPIVELFSQTALEVCEGQQYDMDFENRNDVTAAEYLRMIRLKTAVLLACSLKMGAMLSGAGVVIADQIYAYGLNLGFAFQLQDDLLDSFGDENTFGKKIGSDIAANKKTFLLIKALETASSPIKSRLLEWSAKPVFDTGEKVKTILSIFSDLDIPGSTKKMINDYFEKAESILSEMELTDYQKSKLRMAGEVILHRTR